MPSPVWVGLSWPLNGAKGERGRPLLPDAALGPISCSPRAPSLRLRPHLG